MKRNNVFSSFLFSTICVILVSVYRKNRGERQYRGSLYLPIPFEVPPACRFTDTFFLRIFLRNSCNCGKAIFLCFKIVHSFPIICSFDVSSGGWRFSSLLCVAGSLSSLLKSRISGGWFSLQHSQLSDEGDKMYSKIFSSILSLNCCEAYPSSLQATLMAGKIFLINVLASGVGMVIKHLYLWQQRKLFMSCSLWNIFLCSSYLILLENIIFLGKFRLDLKPCMFILLRVVITQCLFYNPLHILYLKGDITELFLMWRSYFNFYMHTSRESFAFWIIFS